MFYLMMHSTHFFYGYTEGRMEGNVLFNDALNTFYFLLYGVRHMVNDVHVLDQMEMFCLRLSDMIKDHSDNERGNSLLPFDTLQGIFYIYTILWTH